MADLFPDPDPARASRIINLAKSDLMGLVSRWNDRSRLSTRIPE